MSTLQGGFGEAWLIAVAMGCGLNAGLSPGKDLEKADVDVTLLEEVRGMYHPTVKVQVKTQVGLRPNPEGIFSYELNIDAYSVLRRTNVAIPRILVVIGLSGDGRRVHLQEEGTLLVGQGAWVSLEGWPESENTSSRVVKLPAVNTLDPIGLRRMLLEHGVRSSTSVPTVDPWDTDKGLLTGRGESEYAGSPR